MKLWRISQEVENGWDTYDSAVVAAETEDEARRIHPSDNGQFGHPPETWERAFGSWAHSPEQVSVEMIGEAAPGRYPAACVIVASFNAG